MLKAIYEPSFQMIEVNNNFRSYQKSQSVFNNSLIKRQGIKHSLKGNLFFIYNFFHHKKLIKLLKKRISDKKFLRLIERNLISSIQFDKKRIKNKSGFFQGTILCPLLFNIYMHEFDLEIEKIKKEIEVRNKQETKLYKAYTKVTNKNKAQLRKLRKSLNKKLNDNELTRFNFKRLIEKTKTSKKRLFVLISINKNKTFSRIYYCRYADNWVLFTNFIEKNAIVLKKRLISWLKENLYFELNRRKIYLTNLKKNKAKFLGFTFFLRKKTIVSKETQVCRILKQISRDQIYLGIDHKKVKNRMKELKIINKKLKPKHVILYFNLKPWEIVEKFSGKTLSFLNYYYPQLSSPSDLSYYYYVFKYSCLKTLSFQMKITIAQLFKVYGKNLKMKKVVKVKDKATGIIKKKELAVSFPNYINMMDQIGNRIVLEKIVKIPGEIK